MDGYLSGFEDESIVSYKEKYPYAPVNNTQTEVLISGEGTLNEEQMKARKKNDLLWQQSEETQL
jgi:hypothetical protein